MGPEWRRRKPGIAGRDRQGTIRAEGKKEGEREEGNKAIQQIGGT